MAARPSNPWDRQSGESPPAWEAFQKYRDMGLARSLAKVAQDLSKSKPLLSGWSSKHAWVLRAAAWDAEQDRLWQAELRAAQKTAAKKNVDLGNAIKALAGHTVSKMVQTETVLKPQDLARLIEVAARIEQQSFVTIAAAPVGADGLDDVDLDSLTDEEVRFHMQALRRELDAELADYPDLDAADPESDLHDEEDDE